jgi:membrane glycosyltransferase
MSSAVFKSSVEGSNIRASPHDRRVFGSIGILAATVPAAIPYALFIAAGPLLSVPLAILTSLPGAGRALVRLGICALPEETTKPPGLTGLPQ